jgi:hypothetical protein
MNNRTVLVVSGLQYGGKSWLFKKILKSVVLTNATAVSIDAVRKQLYGNRSDKSLTKSEHIFKNEWFRYEIMKQLITSESDIVAEAVMLTRRDHQLPMVEIVDRSRGYLERIAEERGVDKPKVNLRVVFVYARPEVIMDRMSRNQEERLATHSPVFNLSDMWGAYSQFEFPDGGGYTPLYLDTSDEGTEADDARLREIESFVDGQVLFPEEQSRRRSEAKMCFSRMFSMVKESLT